MEMSQLRSFRVVAETLNFTRAAERLNLTQAAVSHQIRALETELGEPLFIRARRGVQLSPAGRVVLEYAARILDDAEAMRESLAGRGRKLSGRVRAAAATQAFSHLFAPLCEAFMREHPQVELSFRTTASTEQTVSDILDGAADVGFGALAPHSPALQVTELFEDELLLVVSPTHALARRQTATAEEIGRERLIVFESGTSIRRTTDDFLKRSGARPAFALESNDTQFIKLMVGRGAGVAFLPSWAVADELQAGRLSALGVEGHALRRSVSVLALARAQTVSTRAFLDFVLARREELQSAARPSLAVRGAERADAGRAAAD
jgi:DNA-binding transcriptional LysR family regulator